MRHYARYTLIALGLAFTFFFDREIAHAIVVRNDLDLRDLAVRITDLALGFYWIGGALSLLLMTHFSLRTATSSTWYVLINNLRAWSAHLLFALLSCGTVVMSIKFLVGRTRPLGFGDLPTFTVSPLSFLGVNQSFPSGHTQVIFCVATLLTYLWPSRSFAFFVLALCIAITRVFAMKHYPSDVYMGMLIGIYGSHLSVRYFSRWVEIPRKLSVPQLATGIDCAS